jgi:predicted ATP-grasp superfamily ATP-dependent carboligase
MRRCPDSRDQPEALLAFLLQLREDVPEHSVIFPTRDDDVLFLNRFRPELEGYFTLLLPEGDALDAALNKWKTHHYAEQAGISSPRSWLIESKDELLAVLYEITFPCVMKPVFAQHWRTGRNWKIVGQRKAVGVQTAEELSAEYDNIAQAERRALIQEMIPGGDECLWIAACYMDRSSNLVAGFTAQKLIQVPEGFGTGCAVQTVHRPDLLALASKLLQAIHFSGIAEVEFKTDPSGDYKLIEINPRPWDQHRLGNACGVDLIHTAFCDLAGLSLPRLCEPTVGHKWIAEDVFSLLLLRSLWRRDGKFMHWLQLAAGPRVYAVSSMKDPLPLLGFLITRFIPETTASVASLIWSRARARLFETAPKQRELHYDSQLQRAKQKP